MSNTAVIVWKSIGISLVSAMLIAAVVWGYLMTPTQTPCASITYIVEDGKNRMYLTADELSAKLRTEDLYPVGRQQNIVSLHRIERSIAAHPMVRTSECYLTPRDEVMVRLTQRVPVMRVQVPGDTYFIDTDRRVMQYRSTVTDSVLLVTGAVGVQMASSQLADFAEWLQGNKYWRTRIDHLYVASPHMIYIYMRNRERVVLGSMYGYERKLRKLRTFYENSGAALEDKQYTELDIRFRGQVIGRK